MAREKAAPFFNTNLDTNLLKLIATISMILDHVGAEFFPELIIFQLAGRLAFPLYCYCMTVGMVYTRDIKKYLFRLGAFAIISQSFWIIAFNQDDILGNITNMNIFFTLFVSLLGCWCFKERKWLPFVGVVLLLNLVNFDYGMTGLIYMIVFYQFRERPAIGCTLLAVFMLLPNIYTILDPTTADLMIGGIGLDWTVTAVLSLPLIYIPTKVYPNIPKYFFYSIYPLHLGLIGLVRFLMRPA